MSGNGGSRYLLHIIGKMTLSIFFRTRDASSELRVVLSRLNLAASSSWSSSMLIQLLFFSVSCCEFGGFSGFFDSDSEFISLLSGNEGRKEGWSALRRTPRGWNIKVRRQGNEWSSFYSSWVPVQVAGASWSKFFTHDHPDDKVVSLNKRRRESIYGKASYVCSRSGFSNINDPINVLHSDLWISYGDSITTETHNVIPSISVSATQLRKTKKKSVREFCISAVEVS